MNKTINKWKTCKPFARNTLYGSIFFLGGCVVYWSIVQNKVVQYVNEDLKIFTPAELKRNAWILNGILKGVGIGLWIKALNDYKRC